MDGAALWERAGKHGSGRGTPRKRECDKRRLSGCGKAQGSADLLRKGQFLWTSGKGDDRPINTEADRAAVLASLEAVDLVVIFKEKVPLKVIEEAHPDIYVKGGDYRIEDLPEAPLVASWGGRTVTVEFEYQRSTTALLEKVRGA